MRGTGHTKQDVGAGDAVLRGCLAGKQKPLNWQPRGSCFVGAQIQASMGVGCPE